MQSHTVVTSVALCDQQFLLFVKNYYFGLFLQFFCSPQSSSFNYKLGQQEQFAVRILALEVSFHFRKDF